MKDLLPPTHITVHAEDSTIKASLRLFSASNLQLIDCYAVQKDIGRYLTSL